MSLSWAGQAPFVLNIIVALTRQWFCPSKKPRSGMPFAAFVL